MVDAGSKLKSDWALWLLKNSGDVVAEKSVRAEIGDV